MFAFISLRSFTLQVVRKSLLPDQSSAAVGEISDEQKSERTKAVYSIIEQELQSKVSKFMCIFCVRSLMINRRFPYASGVRKPSFVLRWLH